jgi:hypothetical protein
VLVLPQRFLLDATFPMITMMKKLMWCGGSGSDVRTTFIRNKHNFGASWWLIPPVRLFLSTDVVMTFPFSLCTVYLWPDFHFTFCPLSEIFFTTLLKVTPSGSVFLSLFQTTSFQQGGVLRCLCQVYAST